MKCCHGTMGCPGAGDKHECESTKRLFAANSSKKRSRSRAKSRSKKALEKEQASLAKARALSDRFTHVVKHHVAGGKFEHIDSEAMLALVGAGLASFAPSARFVLDESGEPVEFTRKEVQRAGENLVSDWLLGTFNRVMKP
jgi:hypothetical protein